MSSSPWLKSCACMLAAVLVLNPLAAVANDVKAPANKKLVEIAPRSSDAVARYTSNLEKQPMLSNAQKLALLRQNIKYVFVLFQENRSFDFYFGTYPGANGLFSQPAAQTPGFFQPIVNTDGSVSTISPFLIPQSVKNTSNQTVLLYPEDTDSVNHGHTAIDAKLDLNGSNIAQNDRYAFTEEGLSGTLSPDGTTYTGPVPTLAQKQKGELVVSHVDCNTAPFLWNYADRFTLFDNFFDTVIGPSTPNAIAMIAGQSGVTQWVKHPELGSNNDKNNSTVPVTGDPQPFWGSALDIFPGPGQSQPTESGAPGTTNPASNLTFASLPLSFMGNQIESITSQDALALDLQDVQNDIKKIAGENKPPVAWAWYQEGYDLEPTDPGVATHATYIAHHDAPQYFGYEANNPVETANHMKGLQDFFNAISIANLPGTGTGGVYYVRGGYGNNDGLVPRSPSPNVEALFPGSDDHPGYSDAQISEALLADEINAIASSPYWPNSAIIITYDETDGLYDHTVPQIRNFDALGYALDQGPRIPAIVVSPYSLVHGISHEASEHGSVIKFIDQLFNLTPLADLPDEAKAMKLGKTLFVQSNLGPTDGANTKIGALFSAFDFGRLQQGSAGALPPSYAMINPTDITSLPHWGANGCRILSINPTDYQNGVLVDPAPADFNPRPSSNPGLPTTPGWPTN